MGFVGFRSDSAGPREIVASLAGGQAEVGSREVNLSVSTWDYINGERNAHSMIVWGDVDPSYDGRIQATEIGSFAIPYVPSLPLVLSAGEGTKTINVKVRNQQRVESSEAEASILLLDGDPHVSVLWRTPRTVWPVGQFALEIHWSASHAFTEYAVCAAPSQFAEMDQCLVLDSDTGTWAAGEAVSVMLDDDSAWEEWPRIASSDRAIRIFALTTKGWTP